MSDPAAPTPDARAPSGDPTVEVLRRLADQQTPAPLDDGELAALLAALPPVGAAGDPELAGRPASPAAWAAVAAAALLLVSLFAAAVPSPDALHARADGAAPDPDGAVAPETAAASPDAGVAVAEHTPSPQGRRVEIRMATGDPSIQVVWVMSENLDLGRLR